MKKNKKTTKKNRNYQSAAALHNKAVSYALGEGVEQNLEQALLFTKAAAEKGFPMAQYNLGLAYFNGDVMEQDYEKGIFWLTKAAKRGVVQAQYNLGRYYLDGIGVVEDIDKAIMWFAQAADNGNEHADEIMREWFRLHGYRMERGEGTSITLYKMKKET